MWWHLWTKHSRCSAFQLLREFRREVGRRPKTARQRSARFGGNVGQWPQTCDGGAALFCSMRGPEGGTSNRARPQSSHCGTLTPPPPGCGCLKWRASGWRSYGGQSCCGTNTVGPSSWSSSSVMLPRWEKLPHWGSEHKNSQNVWNPIIQICQFTDDPPTKRTKRRPDSGGDPHKNFPEHFQHAAADGFQLQFLVYSKKKKYKSIRHTPKISARSFFYCCFFPQNFLDIMKQIKAHFDRKKLKLDQVSKCRMNALCQEPGGRTHEGRSFWSSANIICLFRRTFWYVQGL